MAEVRMIAVDLDGTLLGADGRCGVRNREALKAAQEAGIVVAIATGRRHCYALQVLRELEMHEGTMLVSSNGAVVRDFASRLVERTLMAAETARWLCGHLGGFRDALVVTFDRVQPDGEDTRGALVVESMDELHSAIGPWMRSNERYIEHVSPLERAFDEDSPVQMMLAGSVERMLAAEARMGEDPRVAGVGDLRTDCVISLSRTSLPARDLSVLDILPAGVSKGAALVRLAEARGFGAESIMAIGDNWNDLAMLEMAGFPVLVRNGPAELQAMAAERGWHVTVENHRDGVAEAILREMPGLEARVLTGVGLAGSK